jgi:hypothetical protein
MGLNIFLDASLFSATLSCRCNNLSDSRWPPKSLRRRERHANRGLKSWVQKRGQRMADLIGFFMFGSR